MISQFNELSFNDKDFQVNLDIYLKKRSMNSHEVSSTVAEIIDLIRTQGDSGLKKLTYDLDGFECEDFLLTDEEKEECLNGFDDEMLTSLEFSFQQLLNYQSKCFSSLKLNTHDSITRKFRKIDKVGMYIPGGKASYPSTVLMGAAPAIACGIEDISLASPAIDGKVNDLTVVAAKIAGIKKIYKIGGAQAIAAFALGTEQIPKVDKIIGPGNVYVAEAKKQLFGQVGIDSIAGPSEILILADESSDPETVAWDLMAQSEHDTDASSILISTSSQLIQNVKEIINKEVSSLERSDIISQALLSNGLFINIDNLAESKKIINSFAPE
ncbi:MAG: histidinol dehydrogenase, partial [Pseudomonadota bacterium]|nr:histidinol dehydrogenase [Pseudomonadota bacterium]